jgi:hypothetical protein
MNDGGFIGGLVAGALLLGLGFALGKSSKKLGPRKRFHRSWSRRHMNPGWRARREGRRRRKIDREILAYLREARELMREISNGNPKAAPLIDVEFVVPSGTANETAGAEPGAPEVKEKRWPPIDIESRT